MKIPSGISDFRQAKESLIEALIYASGSISTIGVLLICFFLFREGFGLFGQPQFDQGYSLVVHPANPVEQLRPSQLRPVFSKEITNWKEIGGLDAPIRLLRLSDLEKKYTSEEIGKAFENLPKLFAKEMGKDSNALAVIPTEYLSQLPLKKELPLHVINPTDFLLSKDWYPTSAPVPAFGVMAIVLGTLWVCLGTLVIAMPLGLAVSIYLAEVAPKQVRQFMKVLIELMAGIPSVVYGFFGLVLVVPLIQQTFGLSVGETALAGSIMLGIISLPILITLSEDSLRAVPKELKEASLALGASQWQTIYRVMLPHSVSGVVAAAILAVGRTVGETMAVLMVTGNANLMPTSFLKPVRTITATIAAELGEAPFQGIHFKALFMLACLLFIFTFVLNILGERIVRMERKKLNVK
jgi:phosphate transport system permease protein